jgi:hypothetical protein
MQSGQTKNRVPNQETRFKQRGVFCSDGYAAAPIFNPTHFRSDGFNEQVPSSCLSRFAPFLGPHPFWQYKASRL